MAELKLNEREHATVMAALRYWQRTAVTVDGLKTWEW
jgi:hypothetical protein